MNRLITAGPQAIISSAQDLTASWADLGSELRCYGARKLALWLNVDINNSTDGRIRVLYKHESGGSDEYSAAIEAINTDHLCVGLAYHELSTDADQKVVISFDLGGVYSLDGDKSETFQVIVQDNLTGLDAFRVILQGHVNH